MTLEQIRLARVVGMYRNYNPEQRVFTRLKQATDGNGNLLVVGREAEYSWSLMGYGR